jgi:broad specificity phosphatase PhoE
MKLLLIRHAESQGNYEGRLQGRKEFPLTERGAQQAQALGARLAALKVAAVYSSPIRRAHDTALAVAEKAGLDVTLEPRIQEYDFGDQLSGLTWQEIREQKPEIVSALVRNDSEFPRYPGEEGRGAFRDRVCAAMPKSERHRGDETVRRYARRADRRLRNGDAWPGLQPPVPFTIENTSVTTIELMGKLSAIRAARCCRGAERHVSPRRGRTQGQASARLKA